MNQVALVGRITKDLTVRTIPSGKPYTNFTLAINRAFKNANGEIATDFVLCTAWGRTAETVAKYCGKGSLVGVSGSIQTRHYEREDKTRVYVTEVACEDIRFLSSKSSQTSEMKASSNEEKSRFEKTEADQALPIF